MSLFSGPDEHAANPPSTWKIRKPCTSAEGLVKVRSMDQVGGLVRKRATFRTPIRKEAYGTFVSMTGGHPQDERITEWIKGWGDLPDEYQEQIVTFADYAVWSYKTIIAWHIPFPDALKDHPERVEEFLAGRAEHWVIPDVKYSLTTTQHQFTVRYALRDQEVVQPHYAGKRIYSGCERRAW